ncbi:astacin-like metalloendopeptidase isoform X2 [Rhizophagus irregularis DAOM 181602=DAOM 197198]|nr:astacin-like metalloendopeptidase isoform X2 [Rhizophagus irregularis DAOM 181602=DAOM 197198]
MVSALSYHFGQFCSFLLKAENHRPWSEAMSRMSSVCPIKFVKRKNQKDYIKIVEGDKYESFVGKQGDEQVITIRDTALKSLFSFHGFKILSRWDRDQYVKVGETDIDDINYKKLEESEVICFGSYDGKSIMHYPVQREGQRTEFREGDIHGLNRLYSFARAGTNLSMSNPPIVNDSGKIKNVIYHVTYVLLVVTCALLFIL